MVKVKSLDHTRFVIVGTGVTERARTLYFAGRNSGTNAGDWSTDLGGAKVYNNLHEAQFVMKELQNYHDNARIRFNDDMPFITFEVKLVQRKDVMIARLKYDGEVIG